MRHVHVLKAMILAATVALAGSAGAQVINVTPQVIDFGRMKQHEIRKTKVVVANNGGGELRIKDIKADCGCTVPTMETKVLAPGESTEMEIQFDSKQFAGDVTKNVRITSNDPANPVVDVIIAANVHAPLLIDPSTKRLGFSRSLRGETPSKRAVFTATDVAELKISVDKPDRRKFDFEVIHGVDGDPRKAALEVAIPGDAPVGMLRDNFRIKTNIEDMPTVDIEARASVNHRVMPSPAQINFRFSKDLKQSIRVSPFEKGIEYKVTGAEIDLPEIRVEVLETIPNEETKVLLSGTPIAKDDARALAAKGRMLGTLKIYTDLPEAPVIEVPVSYMIRM